jgi:hypothetical protein
MGDTFINLEDLVKVNRKKEQNMLNLFKEILHKCHELIKNKNSIGYKHLIYDIPLLIFGKPKYDIIVLRNYLVHHLSNNGFYVEILGNGRSIYVNWDEKYIDLEKFYQTKKIYDDCNSRLLNGTAGPDNIDRRTMIFRQQQQRKQEREQRFEKIAQSRKSRFEFQKHRFTNT